MLIIEDPTGTVICRTAIKVLFLYIKVCLHVKLDSQCFYFISLPFQEMGIPQHFGLFYAMGLALIMEGIMSACYHVCPNYSNFQFGKFYLVVNSFLI